MKPARFAWHAPETLEEALALKSVHGNEARFLAGVEAEVDQPGVEPVQPLDDGFGAAHAAICSRSRSSDSSRARVARI